MCWSHLYTVYNWELHPLVWIQNKNTWCSKWQIWGFKVSTNQLVMSLWLYPSFIHRLDLQSLSQQGSKVHIFPLIWHLFPHEIYCICKSRFPFTQAGHYKQEITQERAEIGDRVQCFPPGWAHICRSCFLVPLLSKCPGYCKRPWVWHCRVHLRIFSCLPSTFLCPCTQRRRAPTKICTVLWAQSLVCLVPAASRRRLALKSEEAARTSPHISRNNTKAPLTLKPQPG